MSASDNTTYEIRNYTPKELNLIQHNLTYIPAHVIEYFAGTCEYLDVSQNRLKDLNWLYEFAALQYLVLDNNGLSEIHLQRLQQQFESIKVLMLNKNEFSDLSRTLTEIKRLFPNLEYLSLHGNPICPDRLELKPFSQYVTYDYEQYRLIVASCLPQLKFLDHAKVNRNSCTTMATTDKRISYIQSLWLHLRRLIRSNGESRREDAAVRYNDNDCAPNETIVIECLTVAEGSNCN